MTRRLRRAAADRGSGTLEYLGVVTFSAVLVVALVTATGSAAPLATEVRCSIASITDLGSCPSTAHDAATASSLDAGADEPTNPVRRDTQRDARAARRDDFRPGAEEPPAYKPGGTSGGEPYADGLGDGVPGTTVPVPDPPAWEPADAGAGEHGGRQPDATVHALKLAFESAATAVAANWPHASRNMLHFLGDSGDPIDQDVDTMLDNVKGLDQATRESLTLLTATAVQEAMDSGAIGPVTFPVDTPWQSYYIRPGQSLDWFFALGAIQWNQTGSVTIYPPQTPEDPWRWSATTQVNIRDRYNWDGGKVTMIGPVTVTDESLAELHRAGLAQEYTVTGSSTARTTKGELP